MHDYLSLEISGLVRSSRGPLAIGALVPVALAVTKRLLRAPRDGREKIHQSRKRKEPELKPLRSRGLTGAPRLRTEHLARSVRANEGVGS